MKSLQYYLNIKYPITIYPDEDGGYVAEIKDLPGCLSQGETPDEIMFNINEARELWIETAYDQGKEIPLSSIDFEECNQAISTFNELMLIDNQINEY